MAAGHVGVGLALGRRVAEVAPAVDHLLRRAAADAELQPAAGDEVRGPRVLGHVERVLVAHVDDRGADLDPAGPRADRREQRERRGELPGEMVDAEIGAVGAELLGGDGELDRLQQRVRAPSGSPTRAPATSGRTRETRSSSPRLRCRRPRARAPDDPRGAAGGCKGRAGIAGACYKAPPTRGGRHGNLQRRSRLLRRLRVNADRDRRRRDHRRGRDPDPDQRRPGPRRLRGLHRRLQLHRRGPAARHRPRVPPHLRRRADLPHRRGRHRRPRAQAPRRSRRSASLPALHLPRRRPPDRRKPSPTRWPDMPAPTGSSAGPATTASSAVAAATGWTAAPAPIG